jgi:putative flavoprotein involved in K+ transport
MSSVRRMYFSMYDVVVIGAGQAELAAGYHLKRRDLNFILLEASEMPAGSWPHTYDSLKLFSPAGYSSLPGLKFPGDPERYPTRDEVIKYLTDYGATFELPIRTQTRVQRVERLSEGFRIITNSGDYVGRGIISASGSFNRPYVPPVPGREIFKGKIIHSREYRNPAPFKRKRVVVVGAGNSAIQIAVELAKSAHVTLATREPIRYKPQHVLGKDLHFWLKTTGADWLMTSSSMLRSVSVLDTGMYRRAIEAGQPEHRPMFEQFTETGVVWVDGSEEYVDTVLFATGYRPNLDFLSGIPALDAEGQPQHEKGISTTVPGLYYVGLSHQRGLASATLRGVGPDANYVIHHLIKALQGAPPRQFNIRNHVCCAGEVA